MLARPGGGRGHVACCRLFLPARQYPGCGGSECRAAEAGNARAQYGLGVLLATVLDPTNLAGARTWWTRAAEAGHVGAQHSLGMLLADRLDPPELAEARIWWARAAEAGHAGAQYGLGMLLATTLVLRRSLPEP